ncbi:serine/threonine protein kinase [Anaerobutyricum hallii]|uniref:Serine/threonine protein kinase n=1 Tax=Anaerobutyricum hallii TaxID=39488 RepID=A0A414B7I8_9FIRM|nr:serine/threonine-protein kinase [Anaerobutyricum hallii]RHC66500.1 serine/threonine protein kinase [Anaerobutyricum hallii]
MKKRCFNCMKEYEEQYEVCPHCGYVDGSPPAEAYHLAPGEILNHKYIVGTAIDSGGFGIIYCAWDAQMEQVVAIKEYFPNGVVSRVPGQNDVIVYSGKNREVFRKGVDRFLVEARNMAEFSQPDIVALYDYFEENNTAYIVMEYLDGVSFKEYLKERRGRIPSEEVVDITLHVLAALEEIHSHHIIHRDISPDNIFLCSNHRVKVIDFGAARFSSGEESSNFSTIVKPGYAPAEQYRTKSRQGPFTDLYALGACMYQAATGEKPQESLARAMHDDLRPPKELNPEVPEYLSDIIMKAMAMDEDERFQSSEEFMKALKGHQIDKTPAKKKPKKKKKKGNSVLKMAVAVVLTLLLCAGAFWGITNHTRLVKMGYSGKIEFYVPESKKDYYGEVVNDYSIDYDKEISIVPVADEKYKETVLEKLGTKESPAIFVSDDFSQKELADTENMEKYVVDAIEDSEENFYYLNQYYKKKQDEKRMPLSFNVPLILENRNLGKAVKKAINDSSEFALSAKGKKAQTELYQVKDSVVDLSSGLHIDTKNSVNSKKGIRKFKNGEAAYYITDWADYHKIIESKKYMNLDILYPDKSTKMKVDFSEYISISSKINVQARMEAEDFVMYMALNQSKYLMKEEREDRLPLNKEALKRFSETWTINLASSLEKDDGRVQFENYLDTCVLDN